MICCSLSERALIYPQNVIKDPCRFTLISNLAVEWREMLCIIVNSMHIYVSFNSVWWISCNERFDALFVQDLFVLHLLTLIISSTYSDWIRIAVVFSEVRMCVGLYVGTNHLWLIIWEASFIYLFTGQKCILFECFVLFLYKWSLLYFIAK